VSTLLTGVWLIGVLVSWLVYTNRAGLSDIKHKQGIDWREFLVPNVPYFALQLGKQLIWPVVLVVWLARGRPASPWVAKTQIGKYEVRKVIRQPAGLQIEPSIDEG